MIPLDLLRLNRLNMIEHGSFARALGDPEEIFFIGLLNARKVFIWQEASGFFYSDVADASMDVAAVSGLLFKGDWTSARPLHHLDRNNGALLLKEGRVYLCAASWNGTSNMLIEVGQTVAENHGPAELAFTSWTVCVCHQNSEIELYRRVPTSEPRP